MAASLDYCIPSRRRERQERKEQLALASRVSPRWGDIQITAPSEGGWNQPTSLIDQEKGLPAIPLVSGSPHNSGSSVSTTPDLSVLYDKAVEAGITIENRPEIDPLPQPKEDRRNISFTITLPWPSRRNTPPAARARSTNSPPLGSEQAKTNSRPSTAPAFPPATAHIPASDRYLKDLTLPAKAPTHINPLAQSPPDRPAETFPAGIYPGQPETHVKDVISSTPSPPLLREQSPPLLREQSPPLLREQSSPLFR